MRFLFLCFAGFFLLNTTANAQSDYILSGASITGFGGHGGPVFEIGSVAGENMFFFGGRGGGTIHFSSGNSFMIGGGGYGSVTSISRQAENGENLYLNMSYGGLELEYTLKYRRAFHLAIRSNLGGGSATESLQSSGSDVVEDTNFFIIKPQAYLNMNLTPTVRLQLGAGYRWVTGSNLSAYSDTDLSGFAATIGVKFGFWP